MAHGIPKRASAIREAWERTREAALLAEAVEVSDPCLDCGNPEPHLCPASEPAEGDG